MPLLKRADVETTPLLVHERRDDFIKNIAKSGCAQVLAAFLFALACVVGTATTTMRSNTLSFLGEGPDSGDASLVLNTACAPLAQLSFDAGAWNGVVGARLIRKRDSAEFAFEDGVEMTPVEGQCGQYSIKTSEAALAEGEEFGFYLYPFDPERGTPIKDIGCERSFDGDSRCPMHSASNTVSIGGPFEMAECTTKFSQSDDLAFYNRVYDGTTMTFTWGSCALTCGASAPAGCPTNFPETEDEEILIDVTMTYSGSNLDPADFTEARLAKLADEFAEVLKVDSSMITASVEGETAAKLGKPDEKAATVTIIIVVKATNNEIAGNVKSKLASLTEDDEVSLATAAGISNVKNVEATHESETILSWDAPVQDTEDKKVSEEETISEDVDNNDHNVEEVNEEENVSEEEKISEDVDNNDHNVLSWSSLGTSLVDEKHHMEIKTLGGPSVQYDASENAIVSNGWTGSLDFSSLRTDRSGDVMVRYEVYVPAKNGASQDENGWWYTITLGEDGNSATGDNFSWLHKMHTNGKICAHVPWGGINSCVAGKSFADYTNRWVQLEMRRPAGENRVVYYIDGEQVIDYKPNNDITSDGVLSKLYVFTQPWADPGQTHVAEVGVKIRNIEIRWD